MPLPHTACSKPKLAGTPQRRTASGFQAGHVRLTSPCFTAFLQVAALDLQGMGRSEGKRCFVYRFKHYCADFLGFVGEPRAGQGSCASCCRTERFGMYK